jgi:hypothetical protein
MKTRLKAMWCIYLGALAKLQKATTSPSACLSFRMEQLGFHWTDFDET